MIANVFVHDGFQIVRENDYFEYGRSTIYRYIVAIFIHFLC